MTEMFVSDVCRGLGFAVSMFIAASTSGLRRYRRAEAVLASNHSKLFQFDPDDDTVFPKPL